MVICNLTRPEMMRPNAHLSMDQIVGRCMILKLEGKGIVCDVYYIASDKFSDLTAEAETKSLGLSSLVTKYCDWHALVARGFFSDNSDTTCSFIKDTGELNSLSMDDFESWEKILDEKSDDLDFFVMQCFNESPEPTESQTCLVVYSEFEHGTSATSLPIAAKDSLKGFRFITQSVDCEGFIRRVTYEENIVGSEEYNFAESAIMGIEFNGQNFEIASPTFEKSRTRIWLYKFDDKENRHQLDFVGSKKIKWLSALDDQSTTRIYINSLKS